jgi:xylan 1,4-beta-xylosidase
MPDNFPVTITVAANKPIGAMTPIWRFFGADEPNYAYMRDGKKLLGELGKLSPKNKNSNVFFRTHNLLTSGDGTPALKWGSTNAYTEDANGNPLYDWTILDRIFDAYKENNVRPYVQIGFMPEAMSVKPTPYQHRWTPKAKYDEIYTGWAYPPKDYAKWGQLVYKWTKHCIKRYGKAEVKKWYWEVWNEANIGYWRGTPEEFRKLHDYAIDGVKRALPEAKVGGSDVAGDGGQFQRDFFEHCLRGTNHATGKRGTPIDFVSFHAKGAPTFITEDVPHVRMGIANQLRTINAGFEIVASYPELKNTPIIIGESDPDGCAACQGLQLGYRNTTMFSSYTAAVFARKYLLADRHGVNLEGALTWAFEFENYPLFAGFRAMASGGLDLPVFNVFRMLAKMQVKSSKRVAVQSTGDIGLDAIMKDGVRQDADVSALASIDTSAGKRICVLVWHYHDDDLPGAEAQITLSIASLPSGKRPVKITQYQIDETHSNSFTAWKNMGSPVTPTTEQYAQLEQAGQLAQVASTTVAVPMGDTLTLEVSLSRQAVALFVVEAA